MFPTPDQIEVGQVDFLRNGTGDEFALSPNELYTKAYELNGGLDYRNSVDYYVRVAAVYEDGASPISYATVKQFELETPKNIEATGYKLLKDGEVQLVVDWEPVSFADGYYFHLWDGSSYQTIDIGNMTHFDSEQFKVWPSGTNLEWEKSGAGLSLKSIPSTLYEQVNAGNFDEDYRFYISAYDKLGRESESSSYQKLMVDDFLSFDTSLTKEQAQQLYENAEEGISRASDIQPIYDEDGNEIGERDMIVTKEVKKTDDGELQIDVDILTSSPRYYSGVQKSSMLQFEESFSNVTEHEGYSLEIDTSGEVFVDGTTFDAPIFQNEILATSPYSIAGGISFLTYYKQTSGNKYYLKSYARPGNYFLDRGAGGLRIRTNVKASHPGLGNFKALARSVESNRKWIRRASWAYMVTGTGAIVTFYTFVSILAMAGATASYISTIVYYYNDAKSDMNQAYRELYYIK
jgi:hypothetical protein